MCLLFDKHQTNSFSVLCACKEFRFSRKSGNGRKKLPRKSELRGSLEWIYGFSRSSVWLSKMWNFPFSMFSEIVLPMTVLPPAIFATSI